VPAGELLTWALEEAVAALIEQDYLHRYHESLSNLTPADVHISAGRRSSSNDERRSNE
jgi:hypothetical protein